MAGRGPLDGVKVMVTRPRSQAAGLCNLLAQEGAIPVEVPAVAIEPLPDLASLDAALDRLGSYQWVVFTSANAVDVVLGRMPRMAEGADAFADLGGMRHRPRHGGGPGGLGSAASLRPGAVRGRRPCRWPAGPPGHRRPRASPPCRRRSRCTYRRPSLCWGHGRRGANLPSSPSAGTWLRAPAPPSKLGWMLSPSPAPPPSATWWPHWTEEQRPWTVLSWPASGP